MTSNDNNKRK
jgi:hypothetical protein